MSIPSTTARLSVERLEDRTTPAFLPRTPGQVNFNNTNQLSAGLSVAAGDLFPDISSNQNGAFVDNEYVTSFGPGPVSMILIFGRTGNLRNSFTPIPGFRGGFNVAVGDVLGDSRAEIVVATASGPPIVGVYNAQGQLLSAFFAFSPFYTGGLNVAVGNVLGGIGAGGYNSGYTRELADAYLTQFGVNVSNQFKQEIIIGTASLSSRILVTDGNGNVQRDFFAIDPLYTGGVTVAAASVDKRRDAGFAFLPGQQDTASYDEIIVGAASVAPLVRVYSTWEGGANLEQSYFAYPPLIGLGVNVGAGPSDVLRGAEIYTNLIGTSLLSTFDGESQEKLIEVTAYPGTFTRIINFAPAYFSNFFNALPGQPVPASGFYDPTDDSTFFNIFGVENPDFTIQDLAVVAGDGPIFQQPRVFLGGTFTPAPGNGP